MHLPFAKLGEFQAIGTLPFFFPQWASASHAHCKGPHQAYSTYLYKHLLQQLWNLKQELASFLIIAKNLMMGTPGKGDKSGIQNK